MSESTGSTGSDSALARAPGFLRRNAFGAGMTAALVLLVLLAARWVSGQKGARAPKKEPQFQMVKVVQEKPPPRPPPPPPPPKPVVEQPKPVEEPRTQRMELKPEDVSPTPPPPSAPAGGKLALAAEAEGPGDAFNLSGNPGGRGLLSGGGLGDGDGTGDGVGGGAAARFAWYYGRVASEMEAVFRRSKHFSTAQARLELRIWIDSTGHITRAEPVQPGEIAVREALAACIGLKISEPPPPDIPMPMVARLTARRPQ